MLLDRLRMGPMNQIPAHVPARIATPSDTDAIVSVFTSAFFHDPVWGPAFPDEARRAEQAAVMWRDPRAHETVYQLDEERTRAVVAEHGP